MRTLVKMMVVLTLLVLPLLVSPLHAQWEQIGLDGFRVNAIAFSGANLVAATDSGVWIGVLEHGDYAWGLSGLEGIHLRDVIVMEDGSYLACRFPTYIVTDTIAVLFKHDVGTTEWDTLHYSWAWMKKLGAPFLTADTLLASGDAYIRMSTDGGATWTSSETGWGYTGHFFHFPEADENTFWSGGENDMFNPYLTRTRNRGVTWEQVTIEPGGDNACHDIVSDPNDADRCWVGMEGYVAYTEDGGENWTFNSEPDVYNYNMDMDPRNTDVIYATGTLYEIGRSQVVFRSSDGGESWENLSRPSEVYSEGIICGESRLNNDAMEFYFGTVSSGVWRYRDIETAVSEGAAPATRFVLNPAYPNPFNSSTCTSLTLPISGTVRITVVDVLGRQVEQLADHYFTAGEHRISFDGAGLPSGIYLLVAENERNERSMRKVIFLK